MNSVTLIGRIGGDAELRYTGGGTAVTSINLAIDRGKDQEGEKRAPLWVKVTLWAKKAESLTQYLTKGKLIAVAGEMVAPEAWINKASGDAQSRPVVNARHVEFLGGGKSEDAAPAQPSRPAADHGPEISDEDIPF